MKTHQLKDVDLNLLVILDVLLRTHSTVETARHLGRTQSAISHALQRLRDLLQDPLFIRMGRGMTPTALAAGLAEPLREVLAQAQSLLSGVQGTFSPQRLARTFLVGAPDMAEVLILPGLLKQLARTAPLVDVHCRFLGPDPERQVLAGVVDVMLGASFVDMAGLLVRRLYEEELVVVARRGHPLARGKVTVERFASAHHLLVSPRGNPGGFVDALLRKRGLKRRVVLVLPHFVAAVHVAATTDLLLTMPRRLFERLGNTLDLRAISVPFTLPTFTVAMAFPATQATEPAHAWFRQQIVDSLRAE